MAETNITWDGTRINEIERDALHLESINRNGTVSEMIDTINANFLEIAKHGGGPSGMDGASGLNGEDGVNVEYIYALCDIMEPNTHYPTDDNSKYNLFKRVKNSGSADHNGVTWHDHAQPISKEHKNEYVFSRFRRNVDTEEDTVTSWIYDSKPVLWAHWGETGQDGDGVEYIFMISNDEITDPNALDRLIMKKSAMDEYQKAIFNIDDFYPGAGWFNNSRNKSRVQEVFQNLGLDMSDSTFSSRWGDKFGFTAYGEWTDDPTGVGPDKQYEYVSIRRSVTDENDKKVWGDYSRPALWSNYTFEGRIFIIYCNTLKDATPIAPQKGQGRWINTDGQDYLDMTGLPEGWTDNHRNKEDNEITWMSSGIFDHSGQNLSWSNPVCISGKDGKDGEDGTNIQFIYALSQNPNYPRTYGEKEELFNAVENDTVHNPKYSEWGTTKWYDRAQPISQHDPTEYMWARRREKESDPWDYDPEPIIWAHWGEDGTDGDGVEYIFAVTEVEDPRGLVLPKIANLDESQRKIFQIDDFVPSREWFSKPRSKEKSMEALGETFEEGRWTNYYGFDLTSGWKDDPIPVDHYSPYQWVSIRRSTADEISGKRVWEDFSDPVLWNSYGKSTRVFIIYCNMPTDEEHPDREKPNKPVDGTGTWVISGNDSYLDLTGVVDALTGVTPSQRNLKIGVWDDKNVDVLGTISWMCSGVFTDDGKNISWSQPFRISGEKGEPGEDGDNIEFIYALSTGMPAHPVPGVSMTDEEYDFICSFFYNIDNAKKANLSNPDDPVNEGLDLANIHIDENGIAYYEYTDANGTTAWYDSPQGIDDVPGKRTEWVWQRSKAYDETRWSFTPEPVIWSHWGEDGTDGDGVEYIFHLSQHNDDVFPTNELPPEKPESTSSNRDICKKAIYNLKDFYPDARWFTADTNGDGIVDGRQAAKEAIVDGGLLSETEFNDLWNAEVSNLTYFGLDKDWTDDPQLTTYDKPFQFVSIRKSYTNPTTEKKEWGPYSTPKLWSRYLIQTRVFMVYCNVDEGKTPTPPSLDYGWWAGDDRLKAGQNDSRPYEAPAYDKDNPSTQIGVWIDSDVYQENKIAWICSMTFAENGIAVSSSEPFRITGYRGRPGADGSTIEFVYALCDVEADLKYPDPNTSTYEQLMAFFESVENASNNTETPYYDYNGTHWYDNPQGVSDEDGRKKEWVWSRNKTAGDSSTLWTVPPKPVIWSHWGEDGTDGDGVEYIFCLGTSSTFNVSENQWSSYFDIFNNNATSKAVYSMDDFVPNIIWFANGENMTAVQQKMHDEELGTFSETDYNNLDDYLNATIPWGTLGNWLDNPVDVTASYQYQFVSIRKSENGVWGKFSYPKLWGNYSTAQFTTFAFTATETNIELDKLVEGGTLTLSGGTYDNPYPNDITVNGNTYHWTDGPDPDATRGKIIIWMTTAHVNEGENITNWSVPQKMVDQKGFQVEWCSAEDITPAVRQRFEGDEFNFEIFLKMNGYDENTSEEAWRNAVKNGYVTADSQTVEGLGLQFGDDAENAIYMATCQIKGGVWTNWKLTKVKGEQGEVGPEGRSINVKGFVRYEYYLDEGVTYSVDTATEKFNAVKSSIVPAPNEGDLAIVYPHDLAENDVYYGVDDLGGALCVWKYVSGSWIPYYTDEHIGTDENIGDTYTSPNHHLILWDGDSWQDVGNLVGPTGPAGEILVKYAMDDTDVVVGEGNPLPKRFAEDDEIPFAKYIGFITYPEGQRPAWSFDPNGVGPNGETWNWSLFKGQDGYGYEFIYRGTDTYNTDIILPPNGPNWDVTPNIVPDYWTDEPIEPSLPDAKYVWMGWRKYDFKTQKWTPFYGNKSSSTPKKPVLWAVFMSTITEVHEYYHVDSNISPSDLDTHFGDDGNTIDTEYWVDKETALENWNSENKYLFNVETITYTGDRVEVLDPHLVSVYADGIVDVVDYYCLCGNGSNAPAMNGSIPYTVDTLPVDGVEGIDFWTTDASKTIPNADNRFLWNVSYKIFEDTEKNHWSTPLVAGIYGQGENGADAIYADLDNEMDVVRAKRLEDGTVEVFPNVNNVFTTTVRMYKGSQAMKIKSCSISGEELEGLEGAIEFYLNGDENTPYIEGSNIPGGANSITMKLSVNSNPGNDAFLLLQSEYINIVFAAVGLDQTEPVRMVTYKLVTTTSPVTYKIVPSDNAILIGRVDNQRKPDSLTIDVVENNGENGQVYSGYSITNPFKLWLSINDDDPTEFTSPTFSIDTNGTYTIDGESRKLASGDKLTLMLDADFIGEDGVFETRVDTETIYVLKEVKDGNGYEYCYFRYDSNVSYGSDVRPSVTQATPEDDPVFKIGVVPVASTSEPMGADSSHPFEYRSQRSGYDKTWSYWSDPVTVAKFIDAENIDSAIASAKASIMQDVESNISSALSTYDYLKDYINEDGQFSGTFTDNTKAGLISAVISSDNLTGKINSQIGGFIVDTGSNKTFSTWISETDQAITNVEQNMVSEEDFGELQESVTAMASDVAGATTAVQDMRVYADERFATIDSRVGNTAYMTDDEGYYLVSEPLYTIWCYTKALLVNADPDKNRTQKWNIYFLSEKYKTSNSGTESSIGSYYKIAPIDVDEQTLYNSDYTKRIVILKKIIDPGSNSHHFKLYNDNFANRLSSYVRIKNVTTSSFDFELTSSSDIYVNGLAKEVDTSGLSKYMVLVCWTTVNVQEASQSTSNWQWGIEDFVGTTSWTASTGNYYYPTDYRGDYYASTGSVFEMPVTPTLADNIRDMINSTYKYFIVADTGDSIGRYSSTSGYSSSLDEENGNRNRRRALDSNGAATKNYKDICPEDRPYLVSVVSEIASISESVGDGVSVVSILAAVNDDEDNQIAAAIFAEANESTGSSITLNADRINLSSSHKLSLSSGTFTINSDNFKIDEFGQVTAKGSIMADKFESISNVAYPTDPTLTSSDYVGSLNKSTFVDSSQFNISATGTLSKRTGSGTKEITNSLYITLVDEVINENDDIKENGTTVDKLYAVPTLCMMYNGTPYILNPSIWKSLFSSAQSNMRFIPKYNILRFNIGTLPTSTTNNISNKYFYGSTSATGNGSSKTFKYYITRPDNGDVTGYITNKKSDTLYRIKVLSWGSNKSTEYGYMVSKSIKSSSTDEKTDCAYSTFDKLNTVKYTNPGSGERGTSYINTGSTTEITQDNCTIFQYFKSGGFSFGVNDSSCIYSKTFTSYDDPVDSEYGADKLFNLAITLLKGDSMMYSAGLWAATSETIYDGTYSKSSWDSVLIDNLDDYIPFDTSINVNHDSSGWDEGQFEISIYPVCTISSDALTCTKVIEKVFVNVHVFMIHHTPTNSNITTLIEGSTTLPFTLNMFKIDMNFDLILQFSSSFNNYDPDDSTTYENIISYVKAFLESNNFPYSSLTSNSYKSYYYNWLNINAHVYGDHSVHAWNRNNSNGSNDPYPG